ncbi:MAG: DUF4097 family beta strand repeat-containing protein [Actinomycetota bacterium]|nr:DUF4097 family beta strand repeat-containing protein [Actinomycetota bacterium]
MPTFDTPSPISLVIELQFGAAHLIAGDRVDTVVVVNPSDASRKLDVEAAQKTQVDLANGRLQVKAPKSRRLGRPGAVDVTIELPQDSRLHAEIGLADLRADGRLGETRIHCGLGEIRLDQTRQVEVVVGMGSVTVNRALGRTEITSAGEIRIGEIDGEAEIKNLNGTTWVGEVSGGLRIKSANGDITVDRAHADVAIKTANGSIQIGEVVTGSIGLETGSGGLEVCIRDGSAAWVDASTRFGRVLNGLEAAARPEPSEKAVEIRARTSFGDISILRS